MRVALTYRSPLTYALLEEACLACGVPERDALQDPLETAEEAALDDKERRDAFFDAVLEEPPRAEDTPYADLPPRAKRAAGAYAARDFFAVGVSGELAHCSRRLRRLWEKTGQPASSGGHTTLARVLASFEPERYQTLTREMRLSDLIYYLAVRAVNEAYRD